MGTTAEIQMLFPKEKHARWAMHVTEEMIRLIYAGYDRDAPPWVAEAQKHPTLSGRYLAFRHEAAAYPLNPEGTALEWLRRHRTKLLIDRCQDIAEWESIEHPEGFFPQLCCAYVLRFPQVPFTALCRQEMTVSGAILLYRVQYDGAVLHVQKKQGMWPMDEDDWSRETVHDYIAEDRMLVKNEDTDPMQAARERRAAAVVKTLDVIERRCRPILIGLGGSMAYGLDTPESDVDIRGIFLNPPEELIGLRHEQESLRPDGSDTVLYGLRKAMKLLLDCNPNAIELLGLREQDILYCSEDGRLILDNARAFLSQKAIFTFNGYAVKRRRQIQKLLEEEKTDRKAIAKEMTHLIRAYAMGGDLLVSGRVTTCREREHTLLMDIRAGKYQDPSGLPTSDYERLMEDYMGAFNSAAINTRLPREPDWETVNKLTMEIVRRSLSSGREG